MVESLWKRVLSMNSWRIQWNKFPNFSRWDNFSDFHPLWVEIVKQQVFSRFFSKNFFFCQHVILPQFGMYLDVICGKRKKSIHWMLWGMRNEYQDHHYSAYSASLPLFFAFATSKVKMYHVTPEKKLRSYHSTKLSVSCLFKFFVEVSAFYLLNCRIISCLFTIL